MKIHVFMCRDLSEQNIQMNFSFFLDTRLKNFKLLTNIKTFQIGC